MSLALETLEEGNTVAIERAASLMAAWQWGNATPDERLGRELMRFLKQYGPYDVEAMTEFNVGRKQRLTT